MRAAIFSGPGAVGSVTGPDAYPVTVRLVPQPEKG
jgi:hypothetical protein